MDDSPNADIDQLEIESSGNAVSDEPIEASGTERVDGAEPPPGIEVSENEDPTTANESAEAEAPNELSDQISSDTEQGQVEPEADIPALSLAQDGGRVENWAKLFLSIHREEIAQRDKEIIALKAELETTRDSLVKADEAIEKWIQEEVHYKTQLKGYPDVLASDDLEKVLKTISEIWESCFNVVRHTMQQDLPEEILALWSVHYWPDIEDQIPNILAIPFESTNSPAAKQMRVMLLMALLSHALAEHVLTPNYLLEDDDDLRFLLRTMGNTEKKTLLRRMLLSISDDDSQCETVKAVRVATAVKQVTGAIETLLPQEMLETLKTDLTSLIEDAAAAWEPLQRCESHYEVNTRVPRAGWDWHTIRHQKPAGEEGENAVGVGVEWSTTTTVPSSAFEQDEVLMVLFPRVCAIDRSKRPAFTPVYPGIVFQKSQVKINNPLPEPVPEIKGEEQDDAVVAHDSIEEVPASDVQPPSHDAAELVQAAVPAENTEKPEPEPGPIGGEPGSDTTSNTEDDESEGETTEETEDEDENEGKEEVKEGHEDDGKKQ